MNLFLSPKNDKYSHLDFSDDVPYLEPLYLKNNKYNCGCIEFENEVINSSTIVEKERVVGNFTPQDMKDLVAKVRESGNVEPHWSEFEKKWISFK